MPRVHADEFLARSPVREGPLRGKVMSHFVLGVPSGATWCDGTSVPASGAAAALARWSDGKLKNPMDPKGATRTLPGPLQRWLRGAVGAVQNAGCFDVQLVACPSPNVWVEIDARYRHDPDNPNQSWLDTIAPPRARAAHSTLDYLLMVTAFSGADAQRAAWQRCTAGQDRDAARRVMGFEEVHGRWLDLQHRVVRDCAPAPWFKLQIPRQLSRETLALMADDLQRLLFKTTRAELRQARHDLQQATHPFEALAAREALDRLCKRFANLSVQYHATVRAELRIGN